MKKVFVIMDALTQDGRGLVCKVVEHLSTFIENRLTWENNIPHFALNQDGSLCLNLSSEQMEEYTKVFYMSFDDGQTYRVERRNVY